MDLRAIFLGVAFALMWASAFTSARVIVTYAPPMMALAVRFWISGAIGLIVARAMGEPRGVSRRQLRAILIFGVCQNAIYLGGFFYAMQTIPASLATIIAATMPLLVAALGWLVMGQRTNPLGIVGLIVGLAGVALIMVARLEGGVDLAGVGICVVGVAALAVATLAVSGASAGGNLMTVVSYQMFVAAVVLSGAALISGETEVAWSWQLGVSFVYTVLVPGLLATWVWFILVQRIGAVKAATYHFLTPVFGVAIAWALLDEALSWEDAIGVGIVALGILAVQVSGQRAARGAVPAGPAVMKASERAGPAP